MKSTIATFLLLMGIFCFSANVNAQSNYTLQDVSQILLDQKDRLDLVNVDIQEMRISDQYSDDHNGITHIYVQQQHKGIDILGASIGLHLDTEGELKFLTNHFFSHKTKLIRNEKVQIDAKKALQLVCQKLGIAVDQIVIKASEKTVDQAVVFEKVDISYYDIPAHLVYKMYNNNLHLAWNVEVYTKDQQHYYVVQVDAQSGEILGQKDLVISCKFSREGHQHSASCNHHHESAIPELQSALDNLSGVDNFYRVYDQPVEAPSFGSRTLVGTAGDAVASPLGWHDDGITQHFITKGNNVFAYHDPGPGSTPIPAIGGTPGQSPLVFDYNIDFNLPPAANQPAAITNLFYWNNLIHDIFYYYGFTEAAGNFQTNNLGKGGLGGDAVLAEAQDGSGVNNANFLTLPDGLPGRMQMFLWDSALPLIDGDYDNGVILHEYGHGISTRLTGGPGATCLSGDEQGGEGWSDYFGLMLTLTSADLPVMKAAGRGIGTYVLGEPTTGLGIRPARYTTDLTENAYTYADINASNISAPHGVGFIWCSMLWEMTDKLIDLYGFDDDAVNGTGGNNIALQLVMDGLKLQPCGPTFVEMRDAILAADQINYNGAHACLIWEAFAKRGLGFSAQAGTNARGDEVEAFDMPPSLCQPIINMSSEVTEIVNDGDQIEIEISLQNNAFQAINGIQVSNELPIGTSFASASEVASISGQSVHFNNISVPAGTTKVITIIANVQTGTDATLLFRDDMESDPFAWTSAAGASPFVWTNAEAFSGQHSWFVLDPTYASNQTLTLNSSIQVSEGTHIRFAHRYNTEATFDAGVVETSVDGGQTWTSAGSLFTENGYTDLVPLANNPLIAGSAFGGESPGYVISLADLSPLAGQEANIRFRFSSDAFSGGEGWYIDNFEVVNNPTILDNTASFSMANGFISGSDTNKVLVIGSTANNAMSSIPENTTSASASTKLPFDGTMSMQLSPNPARDQVQIQLNGEMNDFIQIEIMNLQGQILQRRQLNAAEEGFNLDINTSNFEAGAYIIRAFDQGQMATAKLIIQ